MLADGTMFSVAGERLVDASALRASLVPEKVEEFDAWQRGELPVDFPPMTREPYSASSR